ncbi:RNA polymerase sigma factor [Solibacillus daqui]|uniref:RNA polymerase sigma factor n=1 Tax=Solibacillus daqui TaxID=2912187 RepID=UPI002366B37E|nr:RNA polymerase sigma factor [Solibacillus daqui]
MFDLEQDYARYHDNIFRFIYFLTLDASLAEDLMQETFIRAFNGRQSFRQQSNTLTWLRTIARNLVYDAMKRKKIIRFITFQKQHQPLQLALTPEQLLHTKEDIRMLYEGIANLKFEYRAAIVLRKIEELSIKDTADILGWNEAKVRNNTERGMKELQKWMRGELDG